MRPTTRSSRRTTRLAAGVAAVLLPLGATACRGGGAGAGPETVLTAPPGPAAPSGSAPATDGLDAAAPTFGTSADTWPAATVTFTTTDGAVEVVPVRVADTPERRQQGLMQVEEVPAGAGMLFLFAAPIEGGFWMKDTLVPLDIAYIADGEVVSVMQMEPCVEYDDAFTDCPSYRPGVAFDATVEVAQGWFADHGITAGATVETDAEPAAA